MVTIQLMQAGVGDTILVSIIPAGERKPVTRLLIDCGYHFRTNALPVLKSLPVGSKIDRLIITHFDADHIAGAKSFIKKNGHFNNPNILKLDQVWLNTFRHLQDEKRKAATPEDTNKLEALISVLPEPPESDIEGEISASQAVHLGAEVIKHGYPWNTDFDEQAVCIEHRQIVEINDITIILLAPNKNALKTLEDDFIKVLKQEKIALSDSALVDDAFELYLQQESLKKKEGPISGPPEINSDFIRNCCNSTDYDPDDEISNGSSIAFILEAEKKRFLFLGDAHAETIMDAIKAQYSDEQIFPIYFDAVKVAHHGSFRNNHPDLFKLIDSPEWLFSTNGAHPSAQHPDVQTISCIINRPLHKDINRRMLTFNYPLDHLAAFQKADLKTEFNYDLQVETYSAWI